MRILILPLACALISPCSYASETSLIASDFNSPHSPVHQKAQSLSKDEAPMKQEALINAIVQDCLKNYDWETNLKTLHVYKPATFEEFLKIVKDTDLYPNASEFVPLETFYRRLLNRLDIVEMKIQMQKAESQGLKLIHSSRNLSQTAESSSFSPQD